MALTAFKGGEIDLFYAAKPGPITPWQASNVAIPDQSSNLNLGLEMILVNDRIYAAWAAIDSTKERDEKTDVPNPFVADELLVGEALAGLGPDNPAALWEEYR